MLKAVVSADQHKGFLNWSHVVCKPQLPIVNDVDDSVLDEDAWRSPLENLSSYFCVTNMQSWSCKLLLNVMQQIY